MAILDIPFSEYCTIPGLNASKLKAMRRAPAFAQMNREDTASLRKGRALHTFVLEADKFAANYAIGGPINPATNKCYGSDTQKFAAWMKEPEQAGKEVITTEEMGSLKLMYSSLCKHDLANELTEAVVKSGEVEKTLTWSEPTPEPKKPGYAGAHRISSNFTECKARLDGLIRDKLPAAIDLKTTKNASKASFKGDVFNHGYHIQEAWYRRACKANGIPLESFYFIAIENVEPYGVAVYQLDRDWVDAADREINRLLPIYAECVRTNVWPLYPQGVQSIPCPDWVSERSVAV